MKAIERRIFRLEQAVMDRLPIEPWAVFHSLHLHGTPEAAAEEQVFREVHKGTPIVICRTVCARRNPKFSDPQSGIRNA